MKPAGKSKATGSDKKSKTQTAKSDFEVTVKRGKIFLNGKRTRSLEDASGGYRLVARSWNGKVVIKVDHRDDEGQYTSQTHTECRMYPNIQPQDLNYFPKILQHGWIRYAKRKCYFLVEENVPFRRHSPITRKVQRVLARLKRRYNLGDMCHAHVGSFVRSTHNWGITYPGEIVIYDWGFNKYVKLTHHMVQIRPTGRST